MANRNNGRNQNNRNRSRVPEGRITKVPRRKLLNTFRPEIFGAVIFVGIFIYLVVNIVFYAGKDKVSIYEVQGDNISVVNRFKGIALRQENILTSECAGNINYYIQNGKRSAKRGVIFSVDEGSKLYSEILDKTGVDQLQDNDIKQIKNVIYGYLDEYTGFNFQEVAEFKHEVSDTIFELVNDSSIENMKSIASVNSTSSFHIKRADTAGVISYKSDKLCGLDFDNVTDAMYEDTYDVGRQNLRSTGLVSAGEPICRIVTDENWKIAVKIPEDVYIGLLEQNKVSVYINNYYFPVECQMETVQRGSSYYALLSLDKYMPMYIDERILTVEFESRLEGGLKVPLSAIEKREFYVIPLQYLIEDDQFTGPVFKMEGYSEETGQPIYIPVYPSKYYSDNENAYVDTSLFNDGDWVDIPSTGERYKIGVKNSIEGVYVVNKGYYQFVKVERIRQNAEYAIVKKSNRDGLNLYDHIALDASKAKDQAIIY